MRTEQEQKQGRQEEHVDGEETGQRDGTDNAATGEQRFDEIADKRHAGCNLNAHFRREIRLVVPGQQIPGKSESQHEKK